MKDRLMTVCLSMAAAWGLTQATSEPIKQLDVDRLIVRKELIVSDTGMPWEKGFENENIPRGIYARSRGEGTAGLWVRGRLIKGELDDPFDDRFHAMNTDGTIFKAPGHISWNVYVDGSWRQVAILQGEGLESSEHPREQWTGGSHPGRLRFQSFRPNHAEPLTDAILGQGKMSLGGGGFGGGGLPYPRETLELWGGRPFSHDLSAPAAPTIVATTGTGRHEYALIAIGADGRRSAPSPSVASQGAARLKWDSVAGADAYVVLRDGKEVSAALRIEGAEKLWTDEPE